MDLDLLKLIAIISLLFFVQTFGYIAGTTFLISFILLIIKSIINKDK